MFPVRIINADYYMSLPVPDLDILYSEFRGSAINQVPIIRIFGTTDAGKKICLHVHGVFPYLYVPYGGGEDPNILMYQLAANIDKAINISFNQANSTTQHVYKISLVSGVPFYGYHNKLHQYFKIWLYNPSLARKVSNLLQNEVILGKLYQPHEAHIPYILQFMIDYNLHGMSKILLKQLKFRNDPTKPLTDVDPDLILPPSITKQSNCELECDTLSESIANHLDLKKGKANVNPGIQTLWEDEKQRRRDKNQDSQIGPCLSLVNTQVPPTKSHKIFQKVLEDRLAIIDASADSSELNNSVYPAETPQNRNILEASMIDFHSPQMSSTDSTLNQTLDLDATLGEETEGLFHVLQDLGEHREIVEEADSILTQITNDDEEDGEEAEANELDLSLPNLITTPVKLEDQRQMNGEEEEEEEDGDLLDRTLVPQLDGHCGSTSSSEDEIELVMSQKRRRTYKSLPISVQSKNGPDSAGPSKPKLLLDTAAKVKRKLSFKSNGSVVEETLVCDLKLSQSKNNNSKLSCKKLLSKKGHFLDLTPTDTQNISEILTNDIKKSEESHRTPPRQTPQEDQEILNFEHSPNKKQILKDYFSCDVSDDNKSINSDNLQRLQMKDGKDNSEDFFSCTSGSEPEKSINLQLTKAELYDLETNYGAREGCSTIFSQNSQPWSLKSSGENKNNSERSSESIPPFQQPLPQLTPQSSGQSSENYLITPLTVVPTRKGVIDNLDKLKLPHVINISPFYSNAEDVTGPVEVGLTSLKIPSKSTNDVDDFKATFDVISEIRKSLMPSALKFSYDNIKKVKLTFCESGRKVVQPVRKLPTKLEVLQWLSNQKSVQSQEIPKEEKMEKRKIYVPNNSQMDLNESDMELSLTISSCESQEVPKPEVQVTSPILGKGSKKRKPNNKNVSGLSGLTLNNTYGFKISPQNYQNAKAVTDYQFLTVLVAELHIKTRTDLKPNPSYDEIRAIFYSIYEDRPGSQHRSGIFAVNSLPMGQKFTITNDNIQIRYTESEEELLHEFVKFVIELNPEILMGYEIELLSWGYLIDRASILGINLVALLSRTNDRSRRNEDDKNLRITGRITLDFWRLLRHEIALQSYTFESISYHILHLRFPNYSFQNLTFWWDHRSNVYRHRTVNYYLIRVENILKIMEQLDLIGRTSELARLFGIQFYEVLSRGSQFRVESMMLRLAKPMNFIPVSPSVQQRAKMKAPEFLPLILEPESKLYADPVIVLDFQSLYPSMIIAYNYCFSTCLGKVQHLGRNSPFEFGATQYKAARRMVEKLMNSDSLNFSPCGVAFVKKQIRDGIMPRMLREILDTRLMVKNSMKENKDDKTLQKVLHNRQLGLKLIANVTYGYTAANFSGRMPAVELGDSVVSKGRETLQRAIELVENMPEWGAKVVYGDTDSLFVLIPGKSKEEAFNVGKKIADAVTNDNPDPVKLKLEKVYYPCILQTKKRYVGYMYESPDQKEAVYDAKGIETVRRDGCPAVAKILEKSLRILFETRDVSLIKNYVVRQFHKIFAGRVSLQDLTFAREYRGSSGYRPGACVPALELARKWTREDVRNEPRSGERVPYIIANGPPGLPLIRLVRSPRDFLNDTSLRPNAYYYITKVIIPPMNRCLNLIGADLNVWFNQMPRKQYVYLTNSSPVKKSTISQYFATTNCASCGQQTMEGLCKECEENPQKTAVTLAEKCRSWERNYFNVNLICHTCTGFIDAICCNSLDCPVLYKRSQTEKDFQQTNYVREILSNVKYNTQTNELNN